MGKSMIGSVTASVVSAHTGVECDREFTASVSAHTKWKKKMATCTEAWLHINSNFARSKHAPLRSKNSQIMKELS